MTSDGHCYVQIAYHRTVLILPVLILICLVCSNLMTIKGITRAVQPILPDALLEELTSPEHVSLPYLQVPGYKDLVFTGESHVMKFFNPPDNLYGLKFQVIIKEQVVAESGILSPGEEENGDFYQLLKQGYYEITIKATGYGMRNEQEYNTVVQNVTLKVE